MRQVHADLAVRRDDEAGAVEGVRAGGEEPVRHADLLAGVGEHRIDLAPGDVLTVAVLAGATGAGVGMPVAGALVGLARRRSGWAGSAAATESSGPDG